MEEGRISDDVNMRIIRNILTEAFHGIFVGLGLTHIKGNLLFKFVHPFVTALYICTGSHIMYARKLTV